MGKKTLYTPRSRVRAKLRELWLRSRERATALKRDGYRCKGCLKKQSMAKGKEFKVSVHHTMTIGNWEKVIDAVYEEILCDPKYLETLCPECHKRVHGKEEKK